MLEPTAPTGQFCTACADRAGEPLCAAEVRSRGFLIVCELGLKEATTVGDPRNLSPSRDRCGLAQGPKNASRKADFEAPCGQVCGHRIASVGRCDLTS